MTTQEIINEIAAKAEIIRRQNEHVSGPTRDAAIQIIALNGRLSTMNALTYETLHKIASLDPGKDGADMHFAARVALINANEGAINE